MTPQQPPPPEGDYTPGDAPVPVGATVDYRGSQAGPAGLLCVVTAHIDPSEAPAVKEHGPAAAELYVDGVAYDLWPVGVKRKYGNRGQAVYYARRTSFTVVAPPGAYNVEEVGR